MLTSHQAKYFAHSLSYHDAEGIGRLSQSLFDRNRIIYNAHITLSNIPEDAQNHIVNGKSALDWLLDRYQVKIDKKSGIKNDPNDWCTEHNNPRYILDLLQSVAHVSTIVAALNEWK